MEITILEENKNKVKFKVAGESHTILNLIRKELFEDNSVEFAGYRIEHPLVKDAIFTVSTTKGTPTTAIKSAIARLQKTLSKVETEVKKM